MPTRNATARWEGDLGSGSGTMRLPSMGFEGPFTRASRFEEGEATNPEELVGAAHAGCFSMFLSALLSKEDHAPTRIETTAAVTIETTDAGPAITSIVLETEAEVPGIEESRFHELVQEAKDGCPVSKALAGTEISVKASLVAS
ncbi:MAG: OsmC family peroxiredoxin [Nitriliruptorales bacterium]